MDCKPESAARTLLRIECLVLQGIVHCVLRVSLTVLTMPFIPFLVMFGRMITADGRWKWVKRLLLPPGWFIFGLWLALIAPFAVIAQEVMDLWLVTKIEWVNRWRGGHPKLPNGKPLGFPEYGDEELITEAIEESVMRDYPDLVEDIRKE